jgi:twitching motility protein PilT
VQLAIAGNLRGVISQVLLKNSVGGRTPAREVLLNTSAVSGILAEGKTASLSTAIEGGRRYGMVPFNDSLMSLVQSGTVDGREAYRHAHDRAGLLAAFRRQGVDTSFLERLA